MMGAASQVETGVGLGLGLPPHASTAGRSFLASAMLAVVLAWAAHVVEIRPLELLRDGGNIVVFVKGFLRPSFAHMGEYAWQAVVTVCIALLRVNPHISAKFNL